MSLGVLIDGLYSVEYAVNNLAINKTTGSSGSVISDYSPRKVIQAKIEEPPAATTKKAGIRIDIYDPVLSALFAGEL